MNERRQTEESLRAEIARLKAQLLERTAACGAEHSPTSRANRLLEFAPFAVENLSDGTYVITKDARLAYVNRAACQMLGYEEEEMLGMSMLEINPSLTREIWDAVWEVTVRTRKHTIESEHRTKDGRLVPVEILANAIEVEGVGYSCAFTRDITERRKLESRMRQAEKMEAIGQLAGGVAHDFNNQLAGIVGYADLLKGELEDRPELAQFADAILTAAIRSSDLTNQLLAFARQGKNLSAPVDLHPIIGEVVQIFNRSVDKRIVIRAELEAAPAVAIGDPTQLRDAVLNLAHNARDAMPEGGVLTLSTKVVVLDNAHAAMSLRQLDPGRYLKVGVADTGTGMDAETQRRIFDPFFTTKEKGRGTGMGLAAVYGIVKNHRGAIQVHSELRRGTEIDLYLPMATDSAPVAGNSGEPRPRAGIAARVLLVDDETSVRDIVARMLQRLGCEVITVESGKEAIALYRESADQIDVVILDLVMPDMGGKDTFLQLRQLHQGVVAILVSGYSFDGEVQAILDAGAKAFIQKPFRAAELGKKLAAVLGREAT